MKGALRTGPEQQEVHRLPAPRLPAPRASGNRKSRPPVFMKGGGE